MFLQTFKIENVKCFSRLELDFRDEDSAIGVRRWTTLLGENGTGKSTLLQALAVPLMGPGALRELLPVAEGWVRKEQDYGEIEATLAYTEGDQQVAKWPKRTPYTTRFIISGRDPDKLPSELTEAERPVGSAIVPWTGRGTPKQREQISKELNRLKKTAYTDGKEGWFACGYGPFRRLSGGSTETERIVSSGRLAARFVTLFREDAAITTAEKWLVDLYNTARDGNDESDRHLQLMKDVFARELLLEPAELEVDALRARLRFGEASPIPLAALSDGYRSVLALGIDLVRWLVASFPKSADPLSEHGVVLIDELDAHLHPRWQQLIGQWLLKKFPRLQFIIATHSPLLAQVAGPSGNVLLKESGSGEVSAEVDPKRVATWRTDHILENLFGLESTRHPTIERSLNEFLQLTAASQQRTLNDEEKRRAKQLQLELGDVQSSTLESKALRGLAARLESAVDAARSSIRKLR